MRDKGADTVEANPSTTGREDSTRRKGIGFVNQKPNDFLGSRKVNSKSMHFAVQKTPFTIEHMIN